MNILAALLPTGRIHKNVMEAASILVREGGFPESIPGIYSSPGDNNTEAWMLLIADYNGKNSFVSREYDGISYIDDSDEHYILSRAFDGVCYVYDEEINGEVGMTNISHVSENEPDSVWLYPRYWHGWMLPLKLMLMVFSYPNIRLLLFIVHMSLLCGIIVVFYKRHRLLAGMAFLAALFTMIPSTFMVSVDYSTSTLVMEVAVLVMLLFDSFFEKRKGSYIVLFMVIGILTSYYDFLTFPTITLSFPLVIWILNVKDSSNNMSIKDTILEFVFCGIMWGVGYFGMWAAKWIIEAIFIDPNMISDVIEQVRLRSSNSANYIQITVGKVLSKNFIRLHYLPLEIFGAITMIMTFVLGKWKKPQKKQVLLSILLCVVAIIPVLWLVALSNHSYIHDHFTYRNLSGMIFAIFVAVQMVKDYKKS